MRARPRAALALLAALTLGCVAGPAPADRFYRLEPAPPARRLATAPLPGTLVVGRLRSDALAAGRAVLERHEGSPEVEPRPYELWVDPPAAMLEGEIASYLREANVAGRVATSDLRLAPDWELQGRLLRLERVVGAAGPRVHLELELALTRSRDRALRLLETYREEREAAGPRVEDSVAAMEAALAAILERLVDDLAAAGG